jgi:AraC-like DNA-binding protein
MKNLNINKLLNDTLEAIQPIAKQKDIPLIFENINTAFYTNLPMDEVLAPVLWLVLRLLYIIPKGHPLSIKTLQRHDAENNTYFFRIELKTLLLPFNPNLIFRPDNNRFKVEHFPKHSIICIEWALNIAIIEAVPSSSPNPISGSGIFSDDNAALLSSLMITDGVIERFKAFGKSAFVQDKLKATKSHKQQQLLENILSVILKNVGNHDFNSEHLEKQLGLSKSQLFRNLKELTGISTANYIRYIRLLKAAELLETTEFSISEIADKVGFNELSYFSSSFIEAFHVSPTEWRKKQKGNNSINGTSKG